MLVGMDISPTGPWIAPWLLVAIVLVVVVLAAAGVLLALRRRTGPPTAIADAGPAQSSGLDDLPGFLEFPPGSAAEPAPPAPSAAPAAGWPSLAAAPSPPPEPSTHPPVAAGRRRALLVLGASALAALLVVAVLAVLVRPGRPGTDRPDRHSDRATVDLPTVPVAPAPGDPGAGELAEAAVRPGRDGGAARLAFGGLVLEQRAVGITATYPVVEVTWNRHEGVAHLRLPTFNCLTTTAPDDPVAAGCTPTVPEHADLPTPDLAVRGEGGTVQLVGRFPTYVRPNGSPPEWTGRIYEFRVRATPVDGAPAEGWVRAEGEIRLGSGRAQTLDTPDVTVLRRD